MEITLVGTGTPMPYPERGGTAILVRTPGRNILLDCGPNAVYRLVEEGVDISTINDTIFTHHHIDHNSDFHNFLITSWSLGRDELTVYGPDGTQELLNSFYQIYEEDLEYRAGLGYPQSGIEDIPCVGMPNEEPVRIGDVTLDSIKVDHSIETVAYRFEEITSGSTFVFSGDTTKIPELSTFARDADVLVQDACAAPMVDDPPENDPIATRLAEPTPEERVRKLNKTHCTPAEAGQIADEAGVGHLVLTHLLPQRDHGRTYDQAAAHFDGRITIAEDGLTVPV